MANKVKTITVNKGELIPCNGKVISGSALVDESAIVGVSTPILLSEEAGRNQVLGDTLIVDGSLEIECSEDCGRTAIVNVVEEPSETDCSEHDVSPPTGTGTSRLSVMSAIVCLAIGCTAAAVFALVGQAILHSNGAALVCGIVGWFAGVLETYRIVSRGNN